ncbi:MAG TPA: amino acid adenylation domain-containing protein [Jatrophihabitans sp.]|nr:amino acid adenylation domain-containing protein [Jatrophihabitans sp.]
MSGTLFERFARVAGAQPAAPAIEVQHHELSYAELAGLVERLAGRLAAVAGGRPAAVGILASRSLAAYAGYLAALRLGAVVVPLGPGIPAERNRVICAGAGVRVLVADEAGRETAGAVTAGSPVRVLELVDDWPDRLADHPPDDLVAGPDDIAYTLFTSGSTGVPKGVPIRHRNLGQFLDHMIDRFEVGPGCRLSQAFELTFDPSVFDMFVSWCAGATLVVPDASEIFTPVRFINGRQITHWYSVPSVISLARRLRLLRPGCMPDLRHSLFAGEQLTQSQARAWLAAAPRSTLDNLYGPTELTVTCTGYRLPADPAHWPDTANDTVPIGRPNPHLEAVLLDEDGIAADDGELCVRGSQRFAGYLDPAENENRFLDYLPGDGAAREAPGLPTERHWYRTGDRVRVQGGQLVHLGRLDDQVKIHGYRIELGEIESLLRKHPGVHDVVLLAVAAGDGELRLCALYTGDEEVPDGSLNEFVGRRLPGYMTPARYVHVDGFPVSGNGKIDRRQLAAKAGLADAP